MSVSEMRIAITTNNFNQTIEFFRDGLGLDPGELWTDRGMGQIFLAGDASLEVFDPQFAAGVDQIEVGKRVTGQIRLAFQVDDIQNTLEKALRHGASMVHEPVLTPWNHTIVRITSPDGIQITLFQVISDKQQKESEADLKAIVWTKYGPPEVLQLREIEKPQPHKNELLIKIHAASVIAGDCEMRRLQLPLMLSLPMRLYAGFTAPKRIRVLGQEFSGVVEQVGEEVYHFKVGDKVFGTTGFKFGAYAEYICLPANPGDAQGMLTLKPANLDHQESSAIPTAGFEALHYLRRANIKPADKVLIIGAGGSIGTAAIQLVSLHGAKVTAVDSTEKMEMLQNLGADTLVDYTKEDYLKSNERFDIIIDVVGKRGVAKRLKLLKPDGFYFLAYAGFSDLLLKLWISMTSKKKLLIESSSQSKADLLQLKDLAEQGKFKPVIDKVFPLSEAADAHRYAESGKKKGNVVLKIVE